MDTPLEGIKQDAWRISDFTKRLLDSMASRFPNEKISYHFNTIDGWFKDLEKRGTHYVQRSAGEKLYDSLDLEIATFIFLRRKEKFALDMIFDMLPDHIEVRTFPPDENVSEQPRTYEEMMNKIKQTLMPDINKEVEARVNKALMNQNYEIQKMLPSPEEQRAERMNTIMAQQKVTRQLEKEAISIWSEKPKNETMTKVALFFPITDSEKREQFIRNYVDEHFEKAIKDEFGIKVEQSETNNEE